MKQVNNIIIAENELEKDVLTGLIDCMANEFQVRYHNGETSCKCGWLSISHSKEHTEEGFYFADIYIDTKTLDKKILSISVDNFPWANECEDQYIRIPCELCLQKENGHKKNLLITPEKNPYLMDSQIQINSVYINPIDAINEKINNEIQS